MAKLSDINCKSIEDEAKEFLKSIGHRPSKSVSKEELFNLKEILQEVIIHTELYIEEIQN